MRYLYTPIKLVKIKITQHQHKTGDGAALVQESNRTLVSAHGSAKCTVNLEKKFGSFL